MKKTIAILLALITLFSLSTCGKKDKESEAKEEEKYTFYTFAHNTHGSICESYDFASKDLMPSTDEYDAMYCYEDNTVKQQLTLEILGQTHELNYEHSQWYPNTHNRHCYVDKNDSKNSVWILDNHIITAFYIPYTTTAQTKEEVYPLVKELIPFLDLSRYEHSFEVRTSGNGEYSGFDYKLIDPATLNVKYWISYSVLLYGNANRLSYRDSNSGKIENEKENEILAQLETLKSQAQAFLESRIKPEKMEAGVNITYTGADPFIAKDGEYYYRIGFQITVNNEPGSHYHETILVKYND